MAEPFEVKVWESGDPIDLRHHGPNAIEMRPIECHIKKDGDTNDNPSLCFVMTRPGKPTVFAQISLAMFMPVVRELRKDGHLQ